MKYEIKGTPFPVVTCNVNANEAVQCEKGAMTWMTPNMVMSTNAGGGIGKMFSRAFSGESIFQNIYTAEGQPGMVTFGTSFPGEILPIEITPEKGIVAQKSAYLASEVGVSLSIHFQKKIGAGFFGGEGFIMQKLSGSGTAFLEIDGCLVEYDLAAGESMLVDTGYLAAMDETVNIEIEAVKGIGNALFGGEGLFNTKITGPGHVWLQTQPINAVAGTLAKYLPTSR